MEAGFMWQTVTRTSAKYRLKSEITSFVPLEHDVEIMRVVIQNMSETSQKIVPIASVPIYGRSAGNIRDHRHVTSLLHQITVTEQGIEGRPKLSFDERGHQEKKYHIPLLSVRMRIGQRCGAAAMCIRRGG